MRFLPPGEARFLLRDVHDVARSFAWPRYAAHDLDACDLMIEHAERLAEEALFSAYSPMDQNAPRFEGGRIVTHPAMKQLYPALVELGVLVANRSEAVGGLQLPLTVCTLVNAPLMAANLGAYAFAGLTSSAAHLIERFGTDAARTAFMSPMYEGRWTGTMALTEPQAGSSLGDVATRAADAGDGTYRMRGSKVFISGGDHDFAENIVHLTLARIEGAPPGVKGLSLFAVPKLRPVDAGLVQNDVVCTGTFHKLGWRGIPSVALAFGGEHDDCHGWLVGQAGQGLSHMFQMMNEARIMVGLNGVATALAAYRTSVAYAAERTQGRLVGAKDPASPQVPLLAHADVRRMLLRQKAITEGLLSLLVATCAYSDRAEAGPEAERPRAKAILDVLTPLAKTLPAELGFEVNALAVQIHGGYGYTSEYLPEAWLRDQKLNSIHEGTTGIQALDLLGRKLGQNQGAGLRALLEDVSAASFRARSAQVPESWCDRLEAAVVLLGHVAVTLLGRGASGEIEAMLARATEVLALFGTVLLGWQWVEQLRALGPRDDAFARGKRRAAAYWFETEMPLLEAKASVCLGASDSFLGLGADEL